MRRRVESTAVDVGAAGISRVVIYGSRLDRAQPYAQNVNQRLPRLSPAESHSASDWPLSNKNCSNDRHCGAGVVSGARRTMIIAAIGGQAARREPGRTRVQRHRHPRRCPTAALIALPRFPHCSSAVEADFPVMERRRRLASFDCIRPECWTSFGLRGDLINHRHLQEGRRPLGGVLSGFLPNRGAIVPRWPHLLDTPR